MPKFLTRPFMALIMTKGPESQLTSVEVLGEPLEADQVVTLRAFKGSRSEDGSQTDAETCNFAGFQTSMQRAG